MIAVAGGLHGLVYAPLVSTNLTQDSPTYIAAAHALDHGSYSTPLRAGFYYTPNRLVDITGAALPRAAWPAAEKQAFRPPGYPLLLAVAAGGGRGVSRDLALGLNALLFAVGAFVLAITVRRWWGPGIALGAEALYALDPYSKHDVALLLSETLAGALLLTAVYTFTRAWESPGVGWWCATAALLGALTLTRVAFVLMLPLLVLAALVRRVEARQRLAAAAAVCVCAAALVGPWLAWTWHVAGTPVLATYGEGFNLALAAHGEGLGRTESEVVATPGFRRDFAASNRRPPPLEALRSDPFAHPRYVERADSELRRRARSLYLHRLGHEPGQVAWEILYRGYFLWQAHEDWYQPSGLKLLPLRIGDWLVTVLALIGAVLALRRGGPGAAVAILLLVYTFVIATHHVEARFAIPLRGLEFALVALALGEGLRLVRGGRQE